MSVNRTFLHALCVFDRLYAPEAQSVICLSVLERAVHTHTHTLQPGEQRLSRIVLSTFYYLTCPAI